MPASARKILIAAMIVGVAGDRLLRGGTWRLGFAIWVVGIVICIATVAADASRERRLMLGGVLLAAFGLVWRDSPTLYVIDMLSLLSMAGMAVWIGSGRTVADLTVVESVRAGLLTAVNVSLGAGSVISKAVAHGRVSARQKGSAGAIIAGAALAVPPLAVVATLLASSDKVFGDMLTTATTFAMKNGIEHLVLIALLAWIAAGWMHASLGSVLGATVDAPRSPRLPFVSVSIGLYSLIALLGAFIAVQARVIFGGAAFLRQTAGLTVAAYARDGFFQLILASAVVLVTLVMAEWCLTEDDAIARRRYRVAATALLAMVGALLVSSAVRIGLYVNEFGLSTDRMFASSAIVWVSGALAAFAITTLRGHGGRFMPVTLLLTVAWVAGLNLINPDAVVARVNLARAERGEVFDAEFHARLSADALPVLVAGAHRLRAADCMALESDLRKRLRTRFGSGGDASGDWRTRNVPLWTVHAWIDSGAAFCPAVQRSVQK